MSVNTDTDCCSDDSEDNSNSDGEPDQALGCVEILFM